MPILNKACFCLTYTISWSISKRQIWMIWSLSLNFIIKILRIKDFRIRKVFWIMMQSTYRYQNHHSHIKMHRCPRNYTWFCYHMTRTRNWRMFPKNLWNQQLTHYWWCCYSNSIIWMFPWVSEINSWQICDHAIIQTALYRMKFVTGHAIILTEKHTAIVLRVVQLMKQVIKIS